MIIGAFSAISEWQISTCSSTMANDYRGILSHFGYAISFSQMALFYTHFLFANIATWKIVTLYYFFLNKTLSLSQIQWNLYSRGNKIPIQVAMLYLDLKTIVLTNYLFLDYFFSLSFYTCSAQLCVSRLFKFLIQVKRNFENRPNYFTVRFWKESMKFIH